MLNPKIRSGQPGDAVKTQGPSLTDEAASFAAQAANFAGEAASFADEVARREGAIRSGACALGLTIKR